MPFLDFLFELGTEELPPGSLKLLSEALLNQITQRLQQQQLTFDTQGVRGFATPRRLAVFIPALQTRQADREELIEGPPLKACYTAAGQPTPALAGFARKQGVAIEELIRGTERITLKRLVPGQTAAALLPELIRHSLLELPIAKRMRWADHLDEFVRPVHSVTLLLGEQPVPCTVLGTPCSAQISGHRFMAPGPWTLAQAADYENTLLKANVLADFGKRRQCILDQIAGLELRCHGRAIVPDSLLDEVTALVEWPVALCGQFEERFLQVPQEALISTMQGNQKYFPLMDSAGKLLPQFIFIANIESAHPEWIIAGNERVVRPRLSDAEFFFSQDRKKTLAEHQLANRQVIFQAQLGTLADKTDRVTRLSCTLAEAINGRTDFAERAGQRCKADLATLMVGEFPELQGIMGQHYARLDQEADEVASALWEQYLPRHAGDQLPQTQTGIALALADKLDTLVGIFGLGLIPTGSADPFALRRTSLGILRIIIERQLPLSLRHLIERGLSGYTQTFPTDTALKLLEFLTGRYRAYYEEQHIAADTIQAVLQLHGEQPLQVDRRIKALHQFRNHPDLACLAAADKRVRRLLEKQGESLRFSAIRSELLQEGAEITLHAQLEQIRPQVQHYQNLGDYAEVLQLLASLRPSVDQYFNEVMIIVDDHDLRHNRLLLLSQLHQTLSAIADLSQLTV